MIKPDRRVKATLVGTWQLVSLKLQTSSGAVAFPYGQAVEGSLIYTHSGLMSLQIMGVDRPFFASDDPLQGTAAEVEASFMGCVSYYGTYRLNVAEGYVVHEVERSLYPNWEGERQRCSYELTADLLTLRSPSLRWGGMEAVGVFEWRPV